MQVIENKKIEEKVYIEELENGLKIICIPKKNFNKKYAIVGTKFGSIDNCFINPQNNKTINIPDGVAHFLEHKMFEQKDGTNSLDTLSALGVEANAYTTDTHTAYLIECIENFDTAYKELLNYIQNPYFTKENVEKEKGIICQEIKMYEDDPVSKVYQNVLVCLYKKHPVRIDTAGTIQSVNSIDKNVLYDCYNTFYNPANMVISLCGDFEPEKIIEQTKEMILEKESFKNIKRIYPEEPEEINKAELIEKMEISTPIFVIGIKDKLRNEKEYTKKSIAIEILCNLILGNSSNLYKELYNNGDILSEFTFNYEATTNFAHLLIAGQAKEPEKILQKLKREVARLKSKGIKEEDFNRIRKKIYGQYLTDYNDVGDIAKMFLADYLDGINTFDILNEFLTVNLDYIKEILSEVFVEKNMVISIILPN